MAIRLYSSIDAPSAAKRGRKGFLIRVQRWWMSWLPQSTSTEAGKLVCVVSVIEQGPNNEPASFSQTLFARYARVSGCVVMGDRMHLALLGALYTEEQLEKDAAAPEEESDAYVPRPFSRVCLKHQLRRDRENIPRGF